jgi:hypothetical protein
MIKNPDIVLVTCGGKIVCRRCKALSVRTKQQCGRPAIKGKSVCQFHGGRSTGPKSEENKNRLRTLNLKDGFFTATVREQIRITSVKLRYVEDIGHHFGIIPIKIKGRKPKGYIPLDLHDKSQMVKAIAIAFTSF